MRIPKREGGTIQRSILNKLKTLHRGKGLFSLYVFEFFGGKPRTPFRWSKPAYSLPDGFASWDEWENIVVSKILALATRLQPRAELRGLIATKSINKFNRQLWNWLFDDLCEGGVVTFDVARKFFHSTDAKRDNYKVGFAGLSRQFQIAKNWIHFDPPDGTRQLCMFDNRSCARLSEMTEGNFSREVKKLGLVRCAKPSMRVSDSDDGLKIRLEALHRAAKLSSA